MYILTMYVLVLRLCDDYGTGIIMRDYYTFCLKACNAKGIGMMNGTRGGFDRRSIIPHFYPKILYMSTMLDDLLSNLT